MTDSLASPVLRAGTSLSRREEEYMMMDRDAWAALGHSKRTSLVLEAADNRCVVLGSPRAGEEVVLVCVSEGAEAPWSMLPVMASADVERDIASKVVDGSIIVAHYDPLDKEAGLELLDIERRRIAHEELDFYVRHQDGILDAETWYSGLHESWLALCKSYHDFCLRSLDAPLNAKALGLDARSWQKQTGMLFPGLKKMKKVLEHPSSCGTYWEKGLISPFVLASILDAATDDTEVSTLLTKAVEHAAVQPSPERLAATDVEALEEAYPEKKAKPRAQKGVVIVGAPTYHEIHDVSSLKPDSGGQEVTIVKGEVLWQDKMKKVPEA